MINPFKKTPEPTLDPEIANEMLLNIFEQCNKEPNTTPIEVLTSYGNYRRERYMLQKRATLVILVLFFTLPLLFILPAFTLTLNSNSEPGSPVYNVNVKSFLPITRVTAIIDGHNTAVYETGNGSYSIEPARNGSMTVTVTLANCQYSTQDVEVSNVDRDPPRLLSNKQQKRHVYLYVEDENAGIDYEEVYAMETDGERIEPLSYDEETGCIEFTFPESSMNVYIPDKAGNRLQLIISISEEEK